MRGINADQIVDSSLRMLNEAMAEKGIRLDRVTLAVLGRELPAIQTARQHFHATFSQYQIEAEEGTPRSQKIVRDALLRERTPSTSKSRRPRPAQQTDGHVGQAKAEARATARWIVTGIATAPDRSCGPRDAFLVDRSAPAGRHARG
jgi:adenylate cyclase